ncbi:hypothetical protein DPEC_G00178230 [Dallia pectoralis]|uniref:Uncharacterized protein n=1 Tax=Dallia pectoralis TaxID=75939 RepID=A0ACC2GEX5_DALPE|nr:hypothetical protein DPEC_G00178230 [Dallia pectoralis]
MSGAERAEPLMEKTYVILRKHLNKVPAAAMSEVKQEWPFLFSQKCLFSHFGLLTDVDVLQKLHEAISRRGQTILDYCATLDNPKIRDVLACYDPDSDKAASILLLLMLYIKEPKESLMLEVDEIFYSTDGNSLDQIFGPDFLDGQHSDEKPLSLLGHTLWQRKHPSKMNQYDDVTPAARNQRKTTATPNKLSSSMQAKLPDVMLAANYNSDTEDTSSVSQGPNTRAKSRISQPKMPDVQYDSDSCVEVNVTASSCLPLPDNLIPTDAVECSKGSPHTRIRSPSRRGTASSRVAATNTLPPPPVIPVISQTVGLGSALCSVAAFNSLTPSSSAPATSHYVSTGGGTSSRVTVSKCPVSYVTDEFSCSDYATYISLMKNVSDQH